MAVAIVVHCRVEKVKYINLRVAQIEWSECRFSIVKRKTGYEMEIKQKR